MSMNYEWSFFCVCVMYATCPKKWKYIGEKLLPACLPHCALQNKWGNGKSWAISCDKVSMKRASERKFYIIMNARTYWIFAEPINSAKVTKWMGSKLCSLGQDAKVYQGKLLKTFWSRLILISFLFNKLCTFKLSLKSFFFHLSSMF